MTINVLTMTPMNAMMEVIEIFERDGRQLCIATFGFCVNAVDILSGMTICYKTGPETPYLEMIQLVKQDCDRRLAENPKWTTTIATYPIINPDLLLA